MAALRMEDAEMEIRAYTEYNKTEILDLYASVGWTVYTDVSVKRCCGQNLAAASF